MSNPSFIVVTGATGNQGGAAAYALLKSGAKVHALVRNPDAPRALALAEAGATLVVGDLEDRATLVPALEGAQGVFSVQMPDFEDDALEVRLATNLAQAARQAGVQHIVHTSVAGTGSVHPTDEARWGQPWVHYWQSKEAAEQAVRDVSLTYTTVFRPGTYMDNFIYPSFNYYYREGNPNVLITGMDPDSPQSFISLDDFGAAVAAAFADPQRFDGVELEFASDIKTFRQAAAIISEALGRTVRLPTDPAEAEAAGLMPLLARAHEFISLYPLPGKPEYARDLGLRTTSFEDWAHTVLREKDSAYQR